MGIVHSRGTAAQGAAIGGPALAAPPDARLLPRGFHGIVERIGLPTIPLLIAATILAARTVFAPVTGGWNELASDIAQILVASCASLAVVIGLRTATGDHRHYGRRVLAGLLVMQAICIAEFAQGVMPTQESVLVAMFAGAAVMTIYQLTPLVARDVSRPMLVAAALDMAILFASGLAVVTSIADRQGVVVEDATIAVLVCLVGMLAWTATSTTVLFVRGVRASLGGAYVMFGGLALVAMAAASWIATVDPAGLELDAPTDVVFSLGVVMIARGWLTWSLEATERRNAWAVEIGRDLASTIAIMIAIFVVVIGPGIGGSHSRMGTVAEVSLLFGVIAAGIRQVAIKEYERRARLSEAVTSARLVSEISDRGRVARSLEGVEPGRSITLTAERICDGLLALPRADFVMVTSLDEGHEAQVLAAAGAIAAGLVGTPVERGQLERLRDRASAGVWSEPAAMWLEAWLPLESLDHPPRAAHAPLVWEDHLVGILTIGSIDAARPAARATDETSVRAETTAREAAVLVAALVGPALAAESAARRRRERIDQVIAERRFYPVYQPIVALETERIVGFEALTRFEDGGRPDLWFDEAAAAGRGPELEVATLSSAVHESSLLPKDCYLSLNLSAVVASSVEILGRVLIRLPRPVLLEITEHVPVEDYERMMANLYALDIKIRLAVDDAGAGYSGLQHILAIHPHVVKLDAALVRSVDTDVARQAIVGAMVSFAAKTGCTIVAEGAETASEVAMLRSLGVPLVQGYFFGRPRRAEEWHALLAETEASPVMTQAPPPVAEIGAPSDAINPA